MPSQSTDPPSARDDWQRFLTNAARVKSLSLCGSALCQKLLSLLYLGLPSSETPFPNLQTLSLLRFALAHASYVSIVLCPGLSEISVSMCAQDATRFIMGQLSHRSPNLRQIRGGKIPTDVSSILTRFRTLEALDCGDFKLTPPLLYHLAMLPALRTVCASLPAMSGIGQLDTATVFRSLERLNLHDVEDYLTLKHLLRAINTDKLEMLDVEMSFDPRSVDMQELLNAVSAFTNLRSLKLHDRSMIWDGHVFSSLEPLYCLRSLQTLELDLIGADITNNDVPALGKAWPTLEWLTIQPLNAALVGDPPSVDDPPRLTLTALPLFATHLPTLRGLTIVLDATAPPCPDDPPTRSLRPIQLCLEGSPLTQDTWLDAATYISNVYPFAWGLDMHLSDSPDEDSPYWADVARMVPAISRARREEWKRAELASA